MKDWDNLYKEKRIVQKVPSKFVVEAVELFKDHKLKRILDLGCGTGRHTRYLLEQGFEVHGCDASENAVRVVKELLSDGKFKVCDMSKLPYEDGFFDGVLCHQVIQHGKIGAILKAIAEIHRVLRDEGILYLAVPSTTHPKASTGEEVERNTRIKIESMDGEVPHHFFEESELKDLFDKFEILRLEHEEFLSEIDPGKEATAYVMYAKKL